MSKDKGKIVIEIGSGIEKEMAIQSLKAMDFSWIKRIY